MVLLLQTVAWVACVVRPLQRVISACALFIHSHAVSCQSCCRHWGRAGMSPWPITWLAFWAHIVQPRLASCNTHTGRLSLSCLYLLKKQQHAHIQINSYWQMHTSHQSVGKYNSARYATLQCILSQILKHTHTHRRTHFIHTLLPIHCSPLMASLLHCSSHPEVSLSSALTGLNWSNRVRSHTVSQWHTQIHWQEQTYAHFTAPIIFKGTAIPYSCDIRVSLCGFL